MLVLVYSNIRAMFSCAKLSFVKSLLIQEITELLLKIYDTYAEMTFCSFLEQLAGKIYISFYFM